MSKKLALITFMLFGHLVHADLSAADQRALIQRVQKWALTSEDFEDYLEARRMKTPNHVQMPSHWSGDKQSFEDFKIAITNNEVSEKAQLSGHYFGGLLSKVLAHPDSGQLDKAMIGTLSMADTIAGKNLTAMFKQMMFKEPVSEDVVVLVSSALDQMVVQGLGMMDSDLESSLEQYLAKAPKEFLLKCLQPGQSMSLNRAARAAIRDRQDPEFFVYIQRAFSSPDVFVKQAALNMLGARRDQKTLALLRSAIDDADQNISRHALDIVGDWETASSRDLLAQTILKHSSAATRKLALTQVLYQDLRWSRVILKSAVNDKAPEVRALALQLQKRIESNGCERELMLDKISSRLLRGEL